jgi:hypothetical protein
MGGELFMINKPKFYSLNIDELKKDLNIFVDENNRNIIQKKDRPFYTEINVSKSFSAFIPIRTNLPHKYGFITKRNKKGKSGLDYSKAYLVKKNETLKYINEVKTISSLEYRKINQNQNIITNNFKKFLMEINNKIINYDSLGFVQKREVDFSSLQYQSESLALCVNEIKFEINKEL